MVEVVSANTFYVSYAGSGFVAKSLGVNTVKLTVSKPGRYINIPIGTGRMGRDKCVNL
jgi:hypothetical protein